MNKVFWLHLIVLIAICLYFTPRAIEYVANEARGWDDDAKAAYAEHLKHIKDTRDLEYLDCAEVRGEAAEACRHAADKKAWAAYEAPVNVEADAKADLAADIQRNNQEICAGVAGLSHRRPEKIKACLIDLQTCDDLPINVPGGREKNDACVTTAQNKAMGRPE